MIFQKYREYEKPENRGCFAVGESREVILNDLKQYCVQNKDKEIYYYIHPVRPGKPIPVPEYMMEIEVKDKGHHSPMLLWVRAQ